MTDEMTRREKTAANDAARAEAQWGLSYLDDERTASPERLAYEARERGDQVFQIDIVVSVHQGYMDPVRGPISRTRRTPSGAVVDAIEKQGWRLEHVSTSYAQDGALAHGTWPWTVFHGSLTALYVFRRVG